MADDSSLHLSDPLPFPRQFQSKVDWWLPTVLLTPPLGVALVVAAGEAPLWTLPLLAVPLLLSLWILGRTRYTVDETQLEARCGPFRMAVPVATIRALTPTRNPLSSPALSLDRILIEHAGGRLMVSPRNKPGFVRAVLAVAPGVMVSGLPGTRPTDADIPESSFNPAVLPLIGLAIVALAFGGWQLYVGLQPPRATIAGDVLSIGGLYSTTLRRRDVVQLSLRPAVTVVRKVSGFSGKRQLRGIFELEGLGPSRVFLARDSSPVLILHTRTQPVVLALDDPASTRALADDLRAAWHLAP